jgi:hypothetical protein
MRKLIKLMNYCRLHLRAPVQSHTDLHYIRQKECVGTYTDIWKSGTERISAVTFRINLG